MPRHLSFNYLAREAGDNSSNSYEWTLCGHSFLYKTFKFNKKNERIRNRRKLAQRDIAQDARVIV